MFMSARFLNCTNGTKTPQDPTPLNAQWCNAVELYEHSLPLKVRPQTKAFQIFKYW